MDSAGGLFQTRIVGGAEYLYAKDVKAPPPHYPFRVAVQGASATSSWAIMRAMKLAAEGQKLQITWISRSGYQEASPAGRNGDILKKASDNGWLTKATVKAIGKPRSAYHGIELVLAPVAPEPRGPAPDLSDLGKAYKKWYAENTGARRYKGLNDGRGLQVQEIKSETLIFVDHFVYALGADPALPGGSAAIISEAIKGQLSPVVDMDRRFDDDPESTTLAFKTPDNKVWIVGAAVFRGGGIKRLDEAGKKFANIAGMMSEAGSPPEGIAAIIAGAKALTGWDENDSVRRINLHTADFKEIENWFGGFYRRRTGHEAKAATKRAMADQIVAMRKHTVFGLSEEEVANLADPGNAFWDTLFAPNPIGPHPIDQLAGFAK